ncbi:MAG TPA: hypothetical protein VEA40_12280 [Ramlibacter sp.]|nr:hypothetical protein [Ramlibacter sp.]
MFIGHFAAAFAAKALAPRLSLGTGFLAAQFLDLLWPTLLLLGLETVRIAPGATAVTPLVFEHYPISHSLLATLGWSAALGVAYGLLRRDLRGAWVVAVLVLSHWLLDAVVHAPDLPLAPGGSARIGLGLWESLPATLALEAALFAAAVAVYARTTQARDGFGRWGLAALVALLCFIYAGNLFGGPPPGVTAIAWVGQAQWLLVAFGYAVDAHRQPCAAPTGRPSPA